MNLIEAAKLFASYTAWKLSRLDLFGEILVGALDSKDENNRMIAGMFLVRTGSRAVPLVRRALLEQRGLPVALSVAGDLSAEELRPLIERYAGHADVSISRAATAALKAFTKT